MRMDFTRSSKMSNAMLHRVQMLEGRVENMERYSRKLNLIFKGFPKNPSYNDPALPDLTKQQRDEQGELIRARAILKLQKKDVSNVRMHGSKGFYVVIDGEKHFGDSEVIQEALKNNKDQTKNRKPPTEQMDVTSS
ncbi:hypothetical protein AAVH_14557 [Aphelenchoides avenae]|nr:hypothetical protein AAVH_14557 [Aphelenchus avenae]